MIDQQTINFVSYVLAFWGIWKILDGMLHISTRWKRKISNSCQHCRNNLKQAIALESQVKVLESQIKSLEEKLKSHNSEMGNYAKALSVALIRSKVLEKMNSSTSNVLELLYGVGPKRSSKIMEQRPYTDYSRLKRMIGSSVSDHEIYEWADPKWDRTTGLYRL